MHQKDNDVYDCVTVKIKTNKTVRYGNIFIFCSHYYRIKAIGRAEPGWWIFQPGHLTWLALV